MLNFDYETPKKSQLEKSLSQVKDNIPIYVYMANNRYKIKKLINMNDYLMFECEDVDNPDIITPENEPVRA